MRRLRDARRVLEAARALARPAPPQVRLLALDGVQCQRPPMLASPWRAPAAVWRPWSSQTGPPQPPAGDGQAAAAGADAGAAGDVSPADGTLPPVEDVLALLAEREAELEMASAQVAELKDKLARSLADMENLRERTARQAESAKAFAVQSFVKSLLDVADSLELAIAAAKPAPAPAGPPAAGDSNGGLGGEGEPGASYAATVAAPSQLKSLLEGVELTEKMLLSAFRAAGVEKHRPAPGEPFDPSAHNALFQVPDPDAAPGSVAVVTKAGYSLHGRVVRPAEVGVARAP